MNLHPLAILNVNCKVWPLNQHGSSIPVGLVILTHPDSDNGECGSSREPQLDEVGVTRSIGSQPHVQVVSGLVHPI